MMTKSDKIKETEEKSKDTKEIKERVSAETGVSAGAVVLRIVLFMGVFLALFFVANRFFQPEFSRQNSVAKRKNFYSEPKNTIETAILGASISFHSAIPMELYEKFGICAYDFGSSGQPILASYFWLEEAYRLHGDSLKNVMIDVSILRKNERLEWYEAAIDPMKLSPVKIRATYEYSDDLNDTITHLFPLFAYHSRWSELEKIDFNREGYAAEDYLRGYFFNTSVAYYNSFEYNDMEIPNFYPDFGDETVPFKTESLYYMQKLIDFCKEKDIHLVLYKTPGQGMGLAEHNTVQQLADANGLEFYDFNFEPYLSEVGYIRPTDNVDNGHLNYYGASKFTDWIGRYLTEGGYATDVRGKGGYEHMDEQLERYHANVTDVMFLRDAEDPVEYLKKVLANKNFSAAISVKGDAASKLSKEQRAAFAAMGLTKLAELKPYDSYIAVIDNGSVVLEEKEVNAVKKEAYGEEEEVVEDDSDYNMKPYWADDPDVSPVESATSLTMDDVKAAREIRFAAPEEPLSADGKLCDGTVYAVLSGISNDTERASIHLDGGQKSLNEEGLNIAVYDREIAGPVDSAVFDTGVSSLRTGYDYEHNLREALEAGLSYSDLSEELQKLYLYKRRCEAKRMVLQLKKKVGKDDLTTYLDEVMDKDGYAAFVMVKGKAATGIGEGARKKLAALGFNEFSKIEEKDSYIAVVEGGEVKLESREANFGLVSATGTIRPKEGVADVIMYDISSGTTKNTAAGSIVINSTEYAGANRGIYVLVWDTVTNMKVDVAKFDAFTKPLKDD